MENKRIRLLFVGYELFCLLCFAALIFPVGYLYRIQITVPALTWGLCICFCAILLLVWLAVFRTWKHKWGKSLVIVISLTVSFQFIFYLFTQSMYWIDMFELGFVADATTAVRYVICSLFCTASLLGLGIWGFFLHRSTKSEQT